MKRNKLTTYFLAGSLIALIALLATGFLFASSAQERDRTQQAAVKEQKQSDQDGQDKIDTLSQEANQQLKILSGEEIEALIENLANGQPKITKTRVYANGELVDVDESSFAIERAQAVFDPASRSLVVKGMLNGEAVIEDMRFLEFNEKFYVLRDVYSDNAEVDPSLGRSIPMRLDDEAESSGQASGLRAVPSVAAAAPTIRSIDGANNPAAGITNGKVDMSCGKLYNGYQVVNDQTGQYHWFVNGSNFGSSTGTVKLGGTNVPVAANGWTPTRLQIAPTVACNSSPKSTTLTVTTSSGHGQFCGQHRSCRADAHLRPMHLARRGGAVEYGQTAVADSLRRL